MKRSIPALLTTLRLLLGPLALACALSGWPRWLFAPILLVATLSDIYDGVLARRFGVATPALRRYDSVTDMLYYLFVLYSTWLLCRERITSYWPLIVALLASEALCIAISFARFRRFPATHTYLAKLYGLALLACFLALLAFDAPGGWVVLACVVGLAANAEIVLILCRSPVAPVDVVSIFRAPRQ